MRIDPICLLTWLRTHVKLTDTWTAPVSMLCYVQEIPLSHTLTYTDTEKPLITDTDKTNEDTETDNRLVPAREFKQISSNIA